MRRHIETYDRIGEVPVRAHDLERRWQEEDARGRVRRVARIAVRNRSSQRQGRTAHWPDFNHC